MRLLKIGRASNCDIVIPSEFVSSVHAEILIKDDGTIVIEDKNSSNGTFVGNNRLQPNVPTPIMRGDLVRLGNEQLQWNRIPRPVDQNKYPTIINIGTAQDNDIVISSDPYVSRYNASLLIGKDKKAYIVDNGSANGVQVDGKRIPKDKPVPIKPGNVVTVGQTDITEELKPHIPNAAKKLMLIGGGIGAAAILTLLIILMVKVFSGPKTVNDGDWYGTDWNPLDARSAVVYIDAQYTLTVKMEDCPINEDVWRAVCDNQGINTIGVGQLDYAIRNYSATAFFLDENGNLGTNRHVAIPWEYTQEADKNQALNDAELFIEDQLQDGGVLDLMIRFQLNSQGQLTEARYQALRRQMFKCKISITGRINVIACGYPGRNYTSRDEYEKCHVVAVSDTDDKDIAIICLNNKKTPTDIVRVFDLENCFTGTLKPLDKRLVWIGYPRGNDWNLDNVTKSLEPQIRETMCSKAPSKYTFEFQGEALGGASGSPIYYPETGQLVGVLWGGWAAGTTYGLACQARWLRDMYINEIEPAWARK